MNFGLRIANYGFAEELRVIGHMRSSKFQRSDAIFEKQNSQFEIRNPKFL